MKIKLQKLCLFGLLLGFGMSLQNCQEEEINTPLEGELQNKKAKKVKIPDIKFEQALIELGIDDVEDGFVLQSSVESITALFLSNKDISNLSGIKYFTSLVILDCSTNPIESLDVKKHLALEILNFDNTLISNIDVRNNVALTVLSFSNWTGATLPVGDPRSIYGGPYISDIDVSENLALDQLWGDQNQITSLDVSNNTVLNWLFIQSNPLTCIKVNESQLAAVTLSPQPAPYWWNKDPGTNYSLTCP
jgi:Leucine-rich repeat (LRR) protein